jgi:hypothetical protein
MISGNSWKIVEKSPLRGGTYARVPLEAPSYYIKGYSLISKDLLDKPIGYP